MKKRIGLVLVFAAVALASCGNNESENLDPITTTEVNENALSKRVNQLVKNIEKLPDTASVFGSEATKLTARSEHEDYTNPTAAYASETAYNTYYRNLWDRAEELKTRGIEAKDSALEEVREFDKWIEAPNGTRYMVSYDKALDEVHVKVLDNGEIRCLTEVTSGYTVDGKVSIKVNSYYELDIKDPDSRDSQWSVQTLSYIENEKWYFTYRLDRDYVYSKSDMMYVVESDLVTKKVTQLYYDDFYNYDTELDSYVYEVSVQDIVDDYIVVTGSTENGPVTRIFDKEGHDVLRMESNSTQTILSLDLYQCNGLDKATYVDPNADNYYEKEIIINGVDYAEYENDIAEGIHPTALFDAVGSGCAPFLFLYIDKDKAPLESLDYAMENMGFSYKNTINKEKVYEIYNNTSTLVSEREALGIHNFTNVNQEQIISAYNRYNLNKYTREAFLQLYNEPFILSSEQKEDSDVYINVESSFNGTPVFDNENLTINLKNITTASKKSNLLSTNKKYKTVLLLQTKDGYQIVASSNEVTYNNQDMSFIFEDKNIDLNDYLVEGESQSLFLCIGSIDGNNIHAISVKKAVIFEIVDSKILKNHFEDDTLIEDTYLIINEENGTMTFSYITEIEYKPEEIEEVEETTE